jgi:hypothetical protein
VNSGDIAVTATVDTGSYAASAFGIFVQTYVTHSPISIVNSGDATVSTGRDDYGIVARTSR